MYTYITNIYKFNKMVSTSQIKASVFKNAGFSTKKEALELFKKSGKSGRDFDNEQDFITFITTLKNRPTMYEIVDTFIKEEIVNGIIHMNNIDKEAIKYGYDKNEMFNIFEQRRKNLKYSGCFLHIPTKINFDDCLEKNDKGYYIYKIKDLDKKEVEKFYKEHTLEFDLNFLDDEEEDEIEIINEEEIEIINEEEIEIINEEEIEILNEEEIKENLNEEEIEILNEEIKIINEEIEKKIKEGIINKEDEKKIKEKVKEEFKKEIKKEIEKKKEIERFEELLYEKANELMFLNYDENKDEDKILKCKNEYQEILRELKIKADEEKLNNKKLEDQITNKEKKQIQESVKNVYKTATTPKLNYNYVKRNYCFEPTYDDKYYSSDEYLMGY